MIEMRYVGSPHFLKLQYRTLVPTWQASGAWGEPSAWTDWKDVDVVDKPSPPDCPVCKATAIRKGVSPSELKRHFDECLNADR